MKLTTLTELFSLRDLRNGILAVAVIAGGIGLSILTLYAHQADRPRLAGIAAGISLIFVLLILIFVVPPLARNASREASQLNLPFEFTLGGAIMLGLIVIVGFSAWNTGNNLLFLVLSFLAAAMMVGFVAGAISLKKLDVKMRFPETIFAGEATPIFVSLHNRKRLFPSFSVVAEVRGKEREESIAAADLRRLLPRALAERLARAPLIRRTLDHFVRVPARETAENRSSHVFPNRGRFLIKDFEISTKFPFAFFRHRRRLPARETELIVFPKIELLETDIEDSPIDAGRLAANRRGSGQDLLALRDYQPNDDQRRVDWKATARSGSLTVREFAAEDDRKITVMLDTHLVDDSEKRLTLREKIDAEQKGGNLPVSERFESAVSTTASLLSHFTDHQLEVRLVIDREAGEFGIGLRHLHDCLKRLAVVEPARIAAKGDGHAAERPQNGLFEENTDSVFVLTASPEADIPEQSRKNATIVRY